VVENPRGLSRSPPRVGGEGDTAARALLNAIDPESLALNVQVYHMGASVLFVESLLSKVLVIGSNGCQFLSPPSGLPLGTTFGKTHHILLDVDGNDLENIIYNNCLDIETLYLAKHFT
jgi:hypothetical protein